MVPAFDPEVRHTAATALNSPSGASRCWTVRWLVRVPVAV